MRRKAAPALSLLLLLFLFFCLLLCGNGAERDYGVFLGISGEEAERLQGFRTVVIEPSEFKKEQIQKLREAGKTVYGYLNIGAIESGRPYFSRFSDLSLSAYENWPEESWIDVSSPRWRDFLVNELGKEYAELGLDGFFLDNADVYYHYPEEKTYRGLCEILEGLRGFGLPILINGGDLFVSRCISGGRALALFDGINQETVFSSIDFKRKSYGRQGEEESAYFRSYLSRAKTCGLSVYLLEYRADPGLSAQIDRYCRENGFHWYNAEGLELQ